MNLSPRRVNQAVEQLFLPQCSTALSVSPCNASIVWARSGAAVLCFREMRGTFGLTRTAVATYALAVLLLGAGCGGGEGSGPRNTEEAAPGTEEPSISDTASETAATTSESPSTETGTSETSIFEGETFSFEYPSSWQILRSEPTSGPRPLETAFVGPGSRTEAVTMQVFKAKGPETAAQTRNLAAGLREEARKGANRLIEGPDAYRQGKRFTAFFVSYVERDSLGPIARQVGLFYLRGRVYRFTCQYAPAQAGQMDAGCDHALDTLEIAGL